MFLNLTISFYHSSFLQRLQRLIIITVILFTKQFCFAQEKSVSIPGNAFLWEQWQEQKFKRTGLPNLETSKDSLHFRFSTDNQAIDVWTEDYQTFHGTFADFTTSYDPDTSKKTSEPAEFFSKKTNMDTGFSRRIYDLFKSLSIFSIPIEDSIPAWIIGAGEGAEYVIEYSTPSAYSVKYYWDPYDYRQSIKQAATIDNLVNQLESMLNMRLALKTFIHSLPEGCYHSGGSKVMCQLRTR